MPKRTTSISVNDISISVSSFQNEDYICITDMAKARTGEARAADVIKNWIRNRSTLEFLGTWETLYNPDFKVVEFDHFKTQAGLPTFTLSTKQWVEQTGAIGIYVQSGRYGGTYAHKDIAFEFGSAISPVFKLYLIKEYQRLKDIENNQAKLEWSAKRFLSKANYLIHTDAVKNYVLPNSDYSKQTEWLAYADEADLLNVALFGFTAKQWREANPELAKKNNMRDFATINELTVLSNLETHNAELIKSGQTKQERFQNLSKIARYQIAVLDEAEKMKAPKRLLDLKGN
ncbi:MAG: KilA-N domain-containing protein [Anaerovoracaceae bacterium]